jgi:hypothetical protein
MKKEKLILEISTNSLSPAQIRGLKSLNLALEQMQNSKSEPELFEGASEAFRLLAFLVTETKFGKENKLGQQALEYGLDNLNDLVLNFAVLHLDN